MAKINRPKPALIEIKQRKGSKGVMTGANTELFINGKKMTSATKATFEVAARGVAKVTVEFLGNVVVSGKIGQYETKNTVLETVSTK